MIRTLRIAFYVLVGLAGSVVASVNLSHFAKHNPEYEFAMWKVPVGVIAYLLAVAMVYWEAHNAK